MAVLIENLIEDMEITGETYQFIEKAVSLSLEVEKFSIPTEISIMLVDDAIIRDINKEHRKIDKSTDVLSFPMVDMIEGTIKSDCGDYDLDGDVLLLGDIVVSMETAAKQAEEYGHSFDRELAFLVTHGVFHLLGYDHMEAEGEKRMIERQEYVLAQMGLGRHEE